MKDTKIEYYKGKGPGGQNKNKLETACRVTHLPTGITVCCDGRKRGQNRKKALAELKKRVKLFHEDEIALKKKQRRDEKIRDKTIIRTYDYKSNTVKDHRSGKTASIKEVMGKGKIDLLR